MLHQKKRWDENIKSYGNFSSCFEVTSISAATSRYNRSVVVTCELFTRMLSRFHFKKWQGHPGAEFYLQLEKWLLVKTLKALWHTVCLYVVSPSNMILLCKESDESPTEKIGPIILFFSSTWWRHLFNFWTGCTSLLFLQLRIEVPISKLKPSCGTYNGLVGREKIQIEQADG